MNQKLFITATDTDAGKTLFATALIQGLVQRQKKVQAFKPVSAGCERVNGELVNGDAKSLFYAANMGQSIQSINPIAYQEPIAPHIAAASSGESITVSKIQQHFQSLTTKRADFIVTEGAGGWRLPLGNGESLAEFAIAEDMQVIMVVGMKLGCLNHALLTYQAIKADGLNVVGWVANRLTQPAMPYIEENIAELTRLFDAPLLADIGYVENVADAISCIQYELLDSRIDTSANASQS
ncbi:dethiobiotin synthase [Thalassotalea sp. Y01]|uniref:dethiobiotin synthase n=1 Tax=Thalassotalea sp. Y01 TaxID=2729613 RepID=UPI00145EB21B|nr:dethiobiotin synthase [Thalassotalea sp. Y01]NMP15321.1 dethiobiotin synthase [Thalassotalea sp. Y01]